METLNLVVYRGHPRTPITVTDYKSLDVAEKYAAFLKAENPKWDIKVLTVDFTFDEEVSNGAVD